ncbi:MAG TPA: protein translocase subunit SecD [Alphaproteobacteria bacterium]|jgi:preprotein translocase subunit SecD|nr:protein translocase subunit SecD [Alphaproteobacteria bacterium]
MKKLVLIILLTVAATYISLPINKKFDLKLGLDLAGGSKLVFEADMSKLDASKQEIALDSVRNVIEKRVNLFGVSEPTVQTSQFENKSRIIVELPGVTDTKQAVDLIGKTAQLQFFEESGPTNLTGADLESAAVVFDSQTGKPAISLKFTKEGGEKFAEITGQNIGKPLPIVLDNNVISAPVVQEKIVGDSAQISGTFTIEEAKNLAIQLNAGALPVPIALVQQTTVGATLGAESVKQSITAGIVGFAMVIVFMILSYGWFGVVADIGLLIFGVITIALYKLIPITLTLPGIAGFMLSIGMALDGNILIFERFKEEKLKHEFHQALEISFGRAWNSIRDAYVATLITCFVLANPLDWTFLNTSGPIRGFAITLALGIVVSLFTGIFVSRNLLRIFVKEGKK